ncbi:basic proline-rich protein-like [Herpailurus yagouaroundi]|uniref:basic proline-rich protein-like n=1 Tax=Herpailurus yagouaroundi TaxID=1608482 RepID=UPI001AD6D68B|nr:basic proline-rich protein-like [Puma yagouaroundi]
MQRAAGLPGIWRTSCSRLGTGERVGPARPRLPDVPDGTRPAGSRPPPAGKFGDRVPGHSGPAPPRAETPPRSRGWGRRGDLGALRRGLGPRGPGGGDAAGPPRKGFVTSSPGLLLELRTPVFSYRLRRAARIISMPTPALPSDLFIPVDGPVGHPVTPGGNPGGPACFLLPCPFPSSPSRLPPLSSALPALVR